MYWKRWVTLGKNALMQLLNCTQNLCAEFYNYCLSMLQNCIRFHITLWDLKHAKRRKETIVQNIEVEHNTSR